MHDSELETFAAPDADVVLQSSDGVRFGVHRRILIEASPFFKDMFSLPQADRDKEGETIPTPVVDMSESSDVIQALLKMMYPRADPEISTLDELSVLLAAAMKYDILRAISTLRRLLVSSPFVEKEPVRVYAIACRHDLEQEARIASSHTLKMNVLDSPRSEDLKYISAWSYHRLLDLHRRRAEAAFSIFMDANLEDLKCTQCSSAHYGGLCPPRWWTQFVGRAKDELRVRPTTAVVFSMKFLAESGQTGCQKCMGSVLESHAFLERLKNSIDALPDTV